MKIKPWYLMFRGAYSIILSVLSTLLINYNRSVHMCQLFCSVYSRAIYFININDFHITSNELILITGWENESLNLLNVRELILSPHFREESEA